MKQKAIICDLDGTLALIGDRSPYDSKNCHLDAINPPIYDVLDRYFDAGFKIILFSGRDGAFQQETHAWLNKHQVPWDICVLREPGNREKDAVIKERMYRKFVEGKYNVLFVLDDRDQVVKMWRDLGLTCFQVNYGNF